MCHNGAFAVWFLHSKKGGKIQTGLNCEVDSLSKACLWLAYSSPWIQKKYLLIRISIVESAVMCWFSIFLFSWKTNLAEGWFHNYVCQSIENKLHLFCIRSTCAVNIKSPKMKNQRKLWFSWFQRCPLWLKVNMYTYISGVLYQLPNESLNKVYTLAVFRNVL